MTNGPRRANPIAKAALRVSVNTPYAANSIERGTTSGIIAASAGAKKTVTVETKHFSDWSLAEMIDVAHSVCWLGLDVKRFSHALRSFRNLVHPYEQMASGATPDEDTCSISWLVVQAAVNDLARTLKQG